MSEAKTRLLSEARESMARGLRTLAGKNDLDEAFAAWLLGQTEDCFRIDGPLQEALVTGRRSARGVAMLGYSAATQVHNFEHGTELGDALGWISGRPATVAGSPASFTSDALALLGIALGAHHLGDSKHAAAVADWMSRFLPLSCSRSSVRDWELCLYSAAGRLLDAPASCRAPADEATADLRVVLRSRGLLPPVQRGAADADESAALSLMLEPTDGLCTAQLVARIAAFDCIKESAVGTNRPLKLSLTTPYSDDVQVQPSPRVNSMSEPVRDKVFISYSWDSPEHQGRVVSFANALRDSGLTTSVDAFIKGTPPEGFPNWMLNQIRWADFVLCICTDSYRKRCEGQEQPGKGKGVKWEGGIITRIIYEQEFQNDKFIPVVFDGSDVAHIPIILSGATHYDLSSDGGFVGLLRHLTDQPLFVANPVGKKPVLPPRDLKPFNPGS